MNLLTAKELTKHYTDKELFTGADFSIEEKDKVGIVGINGTGKSTLFPVIFANSLRTPPFSECSMAASTMSFTSATDTR